MHPSLSNRQAKRDAGSAKPVCCLRQAFHWSWCLFSSSVCVGQVVALSHASDGGGTLKCDDCGEVTQRYHSCGDRHCPISDSRIIAADSNYVTFLAREGERVGGEREQVPVTMITLEFVRRWCDHIQPDQLTKTRYFGGWCCRKRTAYQAQCRRLLNLCDEQPEDELPSTSLVEDSSEEACHIKCPACESGSLRLISHTPKPCWSKVLTHFDIRCPAWYAETEHAEFCEYLDREYGIGYEDWCLVMRIESTMSPPPEPPPRQLFFSGFTSERDYFLESY